MKIIVQKYGGTSLASPGHIKRIADQGHPPEIADFQNGVIPEKLSSNDIRS